MGHNSGQNGDASVEEILESIKKVIARDNRAATLETRRQRAPVGEDTVEPAHAEEADEILDLGEADLVEYPDEDVSQQDADGRDDESQAGDSPLTGDSVRAGIEANLAALAQIAQPGAQPQIVRSGETSLEGLAREMLRPMLAEWLDANLPDMVETLVKAEIARIAGKRG